MTERHSDHRVCFISRNGTTRGDGSAERPYPSVAAALAASAGNGGNFERGFDMVCLDKPGDAAKAIRKPRYEFFVDEHRAPESANGSESAPWASVQTALAGLAELDKQGAIQLQPGERLALVRHEVFTPTSLERVKKRNETIAKFVFMTAAVSLVVPIVAILIYLVVQAAPSLSLSFVIENPTDMGRAGGIWAPLVGTFMLVFVSLLIAAPIGVLAGVYLNEYAPDNWFTRVVNLAVVNLAGVPSIVHGLFGYGAFVLFLGIGESIIAAACTMAVMTLPVIITSTREALAAVPMSFREACWNMGASRWQTIRTIVLPNSISGILTGVILQVSRVAGETAPILFAGVAAVVSLQDEGLGAWIPFGLNESFMALSYHLFLIRTQIDDVPESIQFATAVILIGLVLLVNSVSIGLRVYLRSRKKW